MTQPNSPRARHANGTLLQSMSYQRSPSLPPAKRGQCTWCHEPITNTKRRTWCSDTCVNEYEILRLRYNPEHQAALVQIRDKGVCALCGVDTEAIKQQVRDIEHVQDVPEQYMWVWRRCHAKAYTWGKGYTMSHLTEVDHILPVSEGGGCCELSNLRTLCIMCHAKESAALRKRLSRKPETTLDSKLERKAERQQQTGKKNK